MTTFSDLNLARPIASVLEKIGYETPTPIQAQSIPPILKGRDLQGIAQTGTGKTAAFTLPILSQLADDPQAAPKRSTRVLILSPTRELARQIGDSVASYARHIDNFKSTVIFGGVKLPRQIKKVIPGNDVIIATPGRLLDLMNQKILNLSSVEYLVLDEADQMMDMGFIHALRKIIPHLPEQRQTLFFSATMPKSIENLAKQFLTNPVKVAVTPESTTAERVEQSVIFVKRQDKHSLLCMKLLDPEINRALVFTRTKHGADRVVKRLASVGLKSTAIHGNKSQGQRTRALTAFKSGEIKFLIATDVAARGIDIRGVSHVFNFEIPNVPEQYVHRIGRTGRAGEAGLAIAFVGNDEKSYLRDIQKMLKTTIPVEPMPSDFSQQVKALKSRKALTKEEMEPAKPEARARKQKGRKSRPAFGEGKPKTSKHRKGPTAQPKDRGADKAHSNDSGSDEASLDHSKENFKRKKKAPSGKPSRAERKRSGAETRGETRGEKSFNRKPRRSSGERSEDGDDKVHSYEPRDASGRKPYKGGKPHRRRDEQGKPKPRRNNRGDGGKSEWKKRDQTTSDRNASDRPQETRREGSSPHSESRYEGRPDRKGGKRADNKSRSDYKGRDGNKGRPRKPRPTEGEARPDKEQRERSQGQGGYGSPKRRSNGDGKARSQTEARSTPSRQKPKQGQNKNKFKRKPRSSSRPAKPRS